MIFAILGWVRILLQPSKNKEQVTVNRKLLQYADELDIKYISNI